MRITHINFDMGYFFVYNDFKMQKKMYLCIQLSG